MGNLLLLIILGHPAVDGLNAKMSKGALAIYSPFGVIALAVVYVGLLYFLIKKRIVIAQLPLFKPFVFFLIIAFVSILFSDFPLVGLRNFAELFSIFVIYLLGANLFSTSRRLENLMDIIIISSIIPLIVALYQVISGTSFLAYLRVSGTISHPNGLAFYLLITFPFLLEKITWNRKSMNKGKLNISSLILLVLTIFVLIKSYTRSAWLGLLVEILILGFLGHKRFLLIIPISAVAIPFLVPDVVIRIKEIFDPRTSSLLWRINMWKELVSEILKKPITGYGIGSSLLVYAKLSNLLFVPHNDYLRILLEMGILGFVPFIYIWFSMLFLSWRLYTKTSSSVVVKRTGRAFTAVIAAYIVISFSDNIFNYSLLLWPLFLVTGAFGSIFRKEIKDAT